MCLRDKFFSKATLNIQLILWVAGINIHNEYRCEHTPDEIYCNSNRSSFRKRVAFALNYYNGSYLRSVKRG